MTSSVRLYFVPLLALWRFDQGSLYTGTHCSMKLLPAKSPLYRQQQAQVSSLDLSAWFERKLVLAISNLFTGCPTSFLKRVLPQEMPFGKRHRAPALAQY